LKALNLAESWSVVVDMPLTLSLADGREKSDMFMVGKLQGAM
jgi:hypothetical protein